MSAAAPPPDEEQGAPLRIAMIGYAFMGRAHSNAWRQAGHFFDLPRTPELAVVCGRSESAVREAANRFGFAEHATDWREVVARDDVDVVDVCTPGDSHAEIALAALAAGKAVLCEKPLANTVVEAEQMAAAAERAGVANMLCHNYRRAPAVQLAKRLLDEGTLGRVHHFRGTYLQDWLLDPEAPHGWRMVRARAGSGALGDLGSHSLDLARFLVGEIASVAGLLETFVAERPVPPGARGLDETGSGRAPVDVDDAAAALLRFENGAIGTMEATRFAAGRKNHNRFEVNAECGSLAFDLERMNELEVYNEDGPESGFRRVLATDPSHPFVETWWPPGHILGYEHTFVHTVVDFVRAVAGGPPARPDFADGVRNQRVLDAIERAARSQQWERV